MIPVKKSSTKSATTEDILAIKNLILTEIREMRAELIAMELQANSCKHTCELENNEERIDTLEGVSVTA